MRTACDFHFVLNGQNPDCLCTIEMAVVDIPAHPVSEMGMLLLRPDRPKNRSEFLSSKDALLAVFLFHPCC